MEFNFKKFFIGVFVVLALFVYISRTYTFQDVLAYDNKHQNWDWGPKIDYYVGAGYFIREQYPEAAGAYEQLLTNYPTCQYAAQSLYRLGTSYQNLEKWGPARDAFQKYMDQYPQGTEIELVNKKFEFIKFK
jgi:outer membrane protein assembly factor BamD (BamD/ComL family)